MHNTDKNTKVRKLPAFICYGTQLLLDLTQMIKSEVTGHGGSTFVAARDNAKLSSVARQDTGLFVEIGI